MDLEVVGLDEPVRLRLGREQQRLQRRFIRVLGKRPAQPLAARLVLAERAGEPNGKLLKSYLIGKPQAGMPTVHGRCIHGGEHRL